jgi:hypothetical protein
VASETRTGTLSARPWRLSTRRTLQRSEQRARTASPRASRRRVAGRRRTRTESRGGTASFTLLEPPVEPVEPLDDPLPLGLEPPGADAGAGSPMPTSATSRSERSTFSRPPLTVLPANAGLASVPPMIAELMSAGSEEGDADQSSAAAPDTCGVAIEVPLAQL